MIILPANNTALHWEDWGQTDFIWVIGKKALARFSPLEVLVCGH